MTCLKTILNKAVEWGKIHKNPAKNIKKLKERNHRLRYLTKEEIKNLYNASADHLRPILIVALNTGMRKSEILNLKWEDIDFHQKIIYIMNTKNNPSSIKDFQKQGRIAQPGERCLHAAEVTGSSPVPPTIGAVVQLARMPDCRSGGRGFESRRPRQ